MTRKTISLAGLALVAALFVWDAFGGAKIDKVWSQPAEMTYPFGGRVTLTVQGRQSPIRIFDVDNEFRLTVSAEGYVYTRLVDLIHGYNDYRTYLNSCSVRWTPEAISFIEPDGAEVRLPVAMLRGHL